MISSLGSKISQQKNDQKHGFLQFSQKLDYGLFLLIELAKKQHIQDKKADGVDVEKTSAERSGVAKQQPAPLSLRTVAEENSMSFFFLQKVAFELRKAGIINAGRGKNGGYVLAKPSSTITLKEIVEILEGPLSIVHCLIPSVVGNLCARQPICQMRHGLDTVNQAIINIFNQTTLDYLLYPTWKAV